MATVRIYQSTKKIEEDPVFTLNPKKVKSVKDPYSQQIQILTTKYRLSNSNIVPRCHEETFHFQEPKIDLELYNLISKKDDPVDNLRKAEVFLNKYKDSVKIYTDGSKDPEEECAGVGLVVFDITDSILLNQGIKLDHRVSIYTCEIIAIDHVLTLLNRRDKSLYKNSNISFFTDSPTALQSLKSGKSHARPEILHNILKSINHFKVKIYRYHLDGYQAM